MKPKISQSDLGQIKIGHAVYATIAAIAARRTHGIAGLESTINDGISRLLGAKHDYEGVKVSYSDNGEIHMTVYIAVTYGYRIPDLVLRLQERIKTAIQTYTSIKVEAIDIVVQDLIFDRANQVIGKDDLDPSRGAQGQAFNDIGLVANPQDKNLLEAIRNLVLFSPAIHALSPRFRDEVEDKLATPLRKERLPGINLKKTKDGLEINLYLQAVYGYKLIDVAHSLQESIGQLVQEDHQLDSVKVDVHFERLIEDASKQEGDKNDQEN